MYESYTRQPLPERQYRELLGSALCVFNSNNAFIVETILRCDDLHIYDWCQLIDKTSGNLKRSVAETITIKCGKEVEQLFADLIERRDRIIHSYQITKDGKQILATKTINKEGNKQFDITEEYLMEFIKLNEQLCDKLHDLRGY